MPATDFTIEEVFEVVFEVEVEEEVGKEEVVVGVEEEKEVEKEVVFSSLALSFPIDPLLSQPLSPLQLSTPASEKEVGKEVEKEVCA